MNRLIITIGILLSGAGAIAQQQPSRPQPAVTSQSTLARVTVYWASGGGGSDCNTRRHCCATGVHLQAGHCAVDPRQIPYGSRVHFPDGVCVAVDTGRDVKNRKAARLAGRTEAERRALVIDRFFETKSQALAWANSHPPFLNLQIEKQNRMTQNAAIGSGKLLASANSASSVSGYRNSR
jgi:3D (Asp-Asp-Asp) domain-containing protein